MHYGFDSDLASQEPYLPTFIERQPFQSPHPPIPAYDFDVSTQYPNISPTYNTGLESHQQDYLPIQQDGQAFFCDYDQDGSVDGSGSFDRESCSMDGDAFQSPAPADTYAGPSSIAYQYANAAGPSFTNSTSALSTSNSSLVAYPRRIHLDAARAILPVPMARSPKFSLLEPSPLMREKIMSEFKDPGVQIPGTSNSPQHPRRVCQPSLVRRP